jgi:hypothetical protein
LSRRIPKATSSPSAELVDRHAEAFPRERQGALPGGAGVAALEVRPNARERLRQVGSSNRAHHGGEGDVGHRELVEGDPLAPFEPALEVAKPARSELFRLGEDVFSADPSRLKISMTGIWWNGLSRA